MRLGIIVLLLIGCAGVKPLSNVAKTEKQKSYCVQNYKNTEKKHLVMAAKIKSSVLANCFRNYLKFEKNKKQKISVCNNLSITRSGKVNYVQVTNANRRQLPKDFKMCIEQEYWTMNFSGLQLDKSHSIIFQLNFSSI